MTALNTTEAKAQCLDILQKWPLFGSCFFAVKVRQLLINTKSDFQNLNWIGICVHLQWIRGDTQHPEHILALNKDGVHFLDVVTHVSFIVFLAYLLIMRALHDATRQIFAINYL